MDVCRNTCCLRAVLFLGLARLVCSAGEPDRAQALIERLADARPAARAAAADGLVALGKDAVARLTDALLDGRPAVRQGAANVLGRIGPGAQSAVGTLAGRLQDPSAEVRASAATALRRIGGGFEDDVVKALADRVVTDKSPDVKREAFQALAAAGGSSHRALAALIIDKKLPRVKATTEILIGLCDAELPTLRQWAILRAPYRIPMPQAWVDKLSALSQTDPNPTVRKVARRRLANAVARSDARCLPPLLKHLTSTDANVLVDVLWGLSRTPLKAEAFEQVSVLIGKHCKTVDTFVALTLGQVPGKRSITVLKKLLGQQYPVGTAAACSLAHHGVWSERVVHLLADAVRRNDVLSTTYGPRRHLFAGFGSADGNADSKAMHMAKTGGKHVVQPLARIVATGTPAERIRALDTLGHIGQPAFKVMEDSLGDEDLGVKRAAAFNLSSLDGGIVALPVLLAALDDRGRDGELARDAIDRLGPRTVSALLEEYRRRLATNKNQNPDLYSLPNAEILRIIEGMGPASFPAIDAFLQNPKLDPTLRRIVRETRERASKK